MGSTERTFLKFHTKIILGLFLILCAGLTLKGEPADSAADSKSPSVKQCRAHIEAALEQYWDQTDEENPSKKAEETAASFDQQQLNEQAKQDEDDDEEEEDPPAKLPEQNQTDETADEDEDEDDDDEDEDDEDEQEKDKDAQDMSDNKETEKEEEEEDEDDEEDEDEDDDEDDDEDEDEEEEINSLDKTEEEEKSEIKDETQKGKADKEQEKEEEEEEEDDEDEEDEEEEEETEGKEEGEEEEEEEEDEEGDEEEEDEEEIKTEEKSDTTKKLTEDTAKTVETAEEIKMPQENISKIDEKVKEKTLEKLDEHIEEKKEEKTEKKPEETAASTIQMKKENVEEATGEPDSAAARVASKFSESRSEAEQSKATADAKETQGVKATPVEEPKTAAKQQNVTSIEDEEEEEDEDEDEEDEDESIENIYEDDEDDMPSGTPFRSRDHIDAILALDDIGTDYDKEEEKLAQSIFREIKKIQATNIKPIEMLYKYGDSTTRLLGDAEIFSKPMILFLGPWSSGKTTIINYLLGTERTPHALKTGTGVTDVDFTVITYGDQRRVISGTELAADWKYASVQKFGQGFLDHFKAVTMPHTLLKRVILVDTPGILENKKNTERGYPFNDAFQWFIDRADAIYVVLDPTKVDIGAELGSVLDQLKGREVRFILNKADTIRRSDLMRVVGQLFWNLSPLMSSTEAPVIYAVSLSTKPFNPTAPAKFLADQENNFLYDLKDTMDKRVENRILYARRHAVRVRNHAKMVDCYLATYYRHKSIFSSKKNVAKLITENPIEYNIYDGLSSMSNVSRYDLPDPNAYKGFFKLHPLYDFKPLASTCSYFRGCPMDKLDAAIAHDLPELLAKYKKTKGSAPQPAKQNGR